MSQPSLLDLLETEARNPAGASPDLMEAADHIRRQNRALTRCYNQLNDVCQNAIPHWKPRDSSEEHQKFLMLKRIRGLQRELKDLLRTDSGPYYEELEVAHVNCGDN